MSEPAVEIEYCVPCGYLNRAVDVQTALLDRFGQQLDRVALVTGDSGVLEVRVDGETVFDKAEDDYDVEGIGDAVAEQVGATA
ncbi:selenoprotein [Halobacteriales archaeon QS_5_70_15]|jgi:selenoprotein W-related protein|nr:MAG: selenoprotein [Halobacteriales archaeon QS_5_70_15]